MGNNHTFRNWGDEMVRFTDNYIKNLKPKKKRDEKYEGGGFGKTPYHYKLKVH